MFKKEVYGVLRLWDKDVIGVEAIKVEDFMVKLFCHFMGEGRRWMTTNIYGSVAYNRKEVFIKSRKG